MPYPPTLAELDVITDEHRIAFFNEVSAHAGRGRGLSKQYKKATEDYASAGDVDTNIRAVYRELFQRWRDDMPTIESTVPREPILP